ncbi:MAG: ferredoxin--NADP reductase [Sandaracinaceae bacterium]
MESIGRRLERRWNTLRNDLRWIGRDLRGAKRPATVRRTGPSRYANARPPRAAVTPRPLTVEAVIRETPDAVTLRLVEASGAPLAFEAGQFLTFHLDVDGRRLRRAYSLSSSPLDGPGATITVKRIEGGRGSAWMTTRAAGDTLMALGPSGSFVAGDAKDLVMIAGGSGITPIASIAETLLRTRDDVSIRLIYGSRAAEDVIFRERLEALASTHDALSLELALEAPPEGWTGPVGRLDARVLGPWLDGLGEGADRAYYLCGPEAMMDAARALLLERGVDAEAILEERFRSPQDAPTAADLPSETVIARIRANGRDTIAPVPPGQTLLEAGLAAGVAMPFSCAMGGCAACKCKLAEGEVAMDEPSCLTDAEREDGWVLACSARPLGPVRVEVP